MEIGAAADGLSFRTMFGFHGYLAPFKTNVPAPPEQEGSRSFLRKVRSHICLCLLIRVAVAVTLES